MRIVFIGAGYVGLVSSACFAELGFYVTCVDVNVEKIEKLRKGKIPIYEPQLSDLIKKNITANRLYFSLDLASSVYNADVVFLAVGTPCLPNSNTTDLSYIFHAAKEVIKYSSAIIVVKSTVPPGTCRQISKFNCDIVSNPEFLREGMAVQDFMHPDRVVIGADNEKSKDILTKLYEKIKSPIIHVSLEAAELIKYSSNAFLAMKIAFINEVSDICESIGADVQKVAEGIGLDTRIGKSFLQPGPGFGGSCFPKDIRALKDFSYRVSAPSKLVDAVIKANETRIKYCFEKVRKICSGNINDKHIAILGLSFKSNTDDIRESVALKLIHYLLNNGAKITAYDPAAIHNAKKYFNNNIIFAGNIYECINNANAIVICTEWEEFRKLEPKQLKSRMISPIIVDLRNLYPSDYFLNSGVRYISIGRNICGKE